MKTLLHVLFPRRNITPYRESTLPATIYLYHNQNACSSQEVRTFRASAKTSKKKWTKQVDDNVSKSGWWNYKIACRCSRPCLLHHSDSEYTIGTGRNPGAYKIISPQSVWAVEAVMRTPHSLIDTQSQATKSPA
jgi:hypothetical protein